MWQTVCCFHLTKDREDTVVFHSLQVNWRSNFAGLADKFKIKPIYEDLDYNCVTSIPRFGPLQKALFRGKEIFLPQKSLPVLLKQSYSCKKNHSHASIDLVFCIMRWVKPNMCPLRPKMSTPSRKVNLILAFTNIIIY